MKTVSQTSAKTEMMISTSDEIESERASPDELGSSSVTKIRSRSSSVRAPIESTPDARTPSASSEYVIWNGAHATARRGWVPLLRAAKGHRPRPDDATRPRERRWTDASLFYLAVAVDVKLSEQRGDIILGHVLLAEVLHELVVRHVARAVGIHPVEPLAHVPGPRKRRTGGEAFTRFGAGKGGRHSLFTAFPQAASRVHIAQAATLCSAPATTRNATLAFAGPQWAVGVAFTPGGKHTHKHNRQIAACEKERERQPTRRWRATHFSASDTRGGRNALHHVVMRSSSSSSSSS